MKSRFAVIAARGTDHAAFEELRALLDQKNIDVEPAFVPSYAAMVGVMQQGVCAFGWAPPLVARDLLRAREASPVALVLRNGTATYWSALVAKPVSHLWHVGQLATARIGWVSRLSAAGYVVPRLHLSAARISLARATESFHYTHAKLADALESDAVDAIATYASVVDGKGLFVPHVRAYKVLGVAGPIPGELVVAKRDLDPVIVRAATEALCGTRLSTNSVLSRAMAVTGFGPSPNDYVESLERLGSAAATDGRGAELGENAVA